MTITVKRVRATALRGSAGPEGPAGAVTGASTFVVSTTQPATPATGASQALVEFTTPNNPAGQPAPAIMRLNSTHNPYAANAQGWTHSAYTNKTVAITVGYTTTYEKQISTEAGAAMIIEHGFLIQSANDASNVKGVEFHWQMTGSDYAGYRPITAFAPWETADTAYDASISFQGALLDFKNGSGTSIISWNFRGALSADKIVSLNGKVQFQHAGNNYAWLKQLNAASNAFLNLPYFNSANNLQVDYASDGVITAWAANSLGNTSAWSRNCGSVPNNARLHYLGANGGSLATVTAYEADMTASTVAINVLRNTHASGAARQVIEANGTGTASIQFGTGFVYANITWNGVRVEFDKPIRITPVAVSALPSASTAGAGAKAIVNDANSTTFASTVAGGGSNVVPVYSDGTNWKIG